MSIVPQQIEITPNWQNYLDLENDILPYLQIPTGTLSDAKTQQLQDVLDAACWWAQDYLGLPIAPTTFFRRFDGYEGFGGSTVVLPYAPVLEVPTVVEYWGASGSRTDTSCSISANSPVVGDPATIGTDVGSYVSGLGIPNGAIIETVNPGVNFTLNVEANITLTPATLVVASGHVLALQTPQNQGNSDMFTLDAINGIIIRSYLGLLQRPTFPGLKNIEVTWTAGYNPVPRHWIMATKELVKYWWDNTQQASRTFVPRGVDYDAPGQHPLWPAVPDRVSLMFQTAKRIGFA